MADLNERTQRYNIEGNAARKLNVRENVVLAPEEEQGGQRRPQRQNHQRTRVQLRPQEKISVTAVAGFVLVAMLAVCVLTSHIQLTDIYADTVAAQTELTQLQETNAKLRAEYETVFDTETLQKAAKEAGLKEPDASQKVYLELADPDNAVVYQTQEQESGLKGYWQAVKAFFAGIGTYFS